MSRRRIVGILVALMGLVLTIGHFVLQGLSNVPERYHGHTSVVAVGVMLMLIGFFMLTAGKER
jgi:multisubunit Na+/H+ antiporter MnhG subunit